MTSAQGPYGPWVHVPPQAADKVHSPAVKLRLFCIPQAGMGAWCFHSWCDSLPAEVEVMPIELPARGTRLGEPVPYAASIPDLARQVCDGLGLSLLLARPFVLFGHSFGAWLATEIFTELRQRADAGWPLPMKVYVSGCRPPQLADVAHDADKANPRLGSLDAYSFWPAFENRYGCNPDLQIPSMRNFIWPVLQADFTLLENYQPRSLAFDVDLCALCAKGDARCPPRQLSAWAACCKEGCFTERWFEGMRKPGSWATVHRYVVDNPGALLRFLHKDLPLVGREVAGYSGVEGPMAEDASDVQLASDGLAELSSESVFHRCALQ